MKPISLKISLVLGVLALAACGQTTGDRALSGGAIGGALMGSPGTGALIGGALGAGTGALTSPSQIDLGRPVWER